MAAIHAGTASLSSVANDCVFSPETSRSLGRETNGDSLRKAAGDMYAKSVLSSSPMVTFRNMAHANKGGVCNSQSEDMLSGQPSRANGSSLSPCCSPAAPLSQLQHRFDRYSENCSIRANACAMGRGGTDSRTGNPERASSCERPSRSLSTLGVTRGPSQGTQHVHSPPGEPCNVACGKTYRSPHSLSPSSMRPGARTLSQRAVPDAGLRDDGMIHLSVIVLFDSGAVSCMQFKSVLGRGLVHGLKHPLVADMLISVCVCVCRTAEYGTKAWSGCVEPDTTI